MQRLWFVAVAILNGVAMVCSLVATVHPAWREFSVSGTDGIASIQQGLLQVCFRSEHRKCFRSEFCTLHPILVLGCCCCCCCCCLLVPVLPVLLLPVLLSVRLLLRVLLADTHCPLRCMTVNVTDSAATVQRGRRSR
jgi:hypothetical protein